MTFINYFRIGFAEEIESTPDFLATTPKLTATNQRDVVLKVEGVELILADIKTWELTLNKKEQEFMDSAHPPK